MLNYIFSVLLLLPTLVFPQACNELMIIAGKEMEEQTFLIAEFTQALYEARAPILVEGAMVQRFLERAHDATNKQMAHRIQKVFHSGAHDWARVKAEIQQQFELLGKEIREGRNFEQVRNKVLSHLDQFRMSYIAFPEGWHVYRLNKHSSLMLLIPQSYFKKREVRGALNDQLEAIGFAYGELITLDVRDAQHLKDEVIALLDSEIYEAFVPFEIAFRTFFNRKSKDPWLFYWSGHGTSPERFNATEIDRDIRLLQEILRTAPQKIEDVDRQLFQMEGNRRSLEKALKAGDTERMLKLLVMLVQKKWLGAQLWPEAPELLKQMVREQKNPLESFDRSEKTIRDQLSKSSDSARKELLEGLLIGLQRNREKLLEELKNAQTWMPNLFRALEPSVEQLERERKGYDVLPLKIAALEAEKKALGRRYARGESFLSGERAGVSAQDFILVLKVMSQDIKTRFVFIKSCFSGGVHQSFMRHILRGLKSQCMVAMAGVNETVVYAESLQVPFAFKEGRPVFQYGSSFTDFFDLSCDYFENQQAFVKKAKSLGSKDNNPLSIILKSLVPSRFTKTNQPFLLIPHVGVFEAIAIDSDVYVLTDVRVKASAFARRVLDLHTYKGVIVTSGYIETPLLVSDTTRIVSQRMFDIVKPYRGPTHVFEEITRLPVAQGARENLTTCLKLVTDNPSLYKLFLIKQSGKQPKCVTNVIIRMRGNPSPEGTPGGWVDVFYTDAESGKSYFGSVRLDSFEQDLLFDMLDQKFTEVTQRQLVGFATETVERFAQVNEQVGQMGLEKERSALTQEFEESRKNASLPLLFETLAQDLKTAVGIEAVEKQKSVGEVVQQKIERAKKKS